MVQKGKDSFINLTNMLEKLLKQNKKQVEKLLVFIK